MTIHFSSSVIFVKDILKSKDFYCGLLNQKVKHDYGKNIEFESGLCIWELRDSHIISESMGHQTKILSNRFELCFETDDIESAFAKLEEAEVDLLHDIHTEPWTQKTVRFFDPDGHLVEIGESLETFVVRSYETLKDPEEVSRATFVPLERVRKIVKQ